MLQRLLRRLLHRPVASIVDRKLAADPRLGRIDRVRAMDHAFEFVSRSGLDGHYLEFGCYDGASFVRAHRAYHHWLSAPGVPGRTMTRRRMFAFDSFAGLPPLEPEDRFPGYDAFREGQYACSRQSFLDRLARAGVDPDLVEVVEGPFAETLVQEGAAEVATGPALVVHVDCDLYSSAVPVFRFLTGRIQDGTVLLLDDFLCYRGHPGYGVQRAFREWVQAEGLAAHLYFGYGWAGTAWIVSRP